MSAMTQRTAHADSPTIEVVISGELDAAAVPHVRPLVDPALARRPGVLVVDLAGCHLIDAAGIALLLDVHRRAWMADGRLALRSATPQVQRILEIARVAHILHVEAETYGPTLSPTAPQADQCRAHDKEDCYDVISACGDRPGRGCRKGW